MAPFTPAAKSNPKGQRSSVNFLEELVATIEDNVDLTLPEKEQLGIYLQEQDTLCTITHLDDGSAF